MTTIQTTVAGIPCLARMTYYVPADPGRTYGPPEDCWPPEQAVVDFDLLDRRGRAAPWLERKMTDEDFGRIEIELIEAVEEGDEC
jgi:hypothetical protein